MVVDDEEKLNRLITYNLEKEGFATTSVLDGSEVMNLVRLQRPDLIILDLMLPGRDGLELCRDMRKANIKTPIIMLTARDDEIDKVLGLEMGADDYVTKPFSVRELIARVKAILRRNLQNDESLEPSQPLQSGQFAIYPERYEIHFKGKLLDLTLKEYELLDILLRNKGRVLKRDYLLQVLWDYADSANTRVLDVHISKLRDKIEEDAKNPRHIKTVRGLGYKFEEGDNA
ncbi:MAG: response regulator transcription factor [Syntrophomonadaceae bacterium]